MIYLTGDTHGEVDIGKITKAGWIESKNLTKKDYLIILGDFGLIWYPEPSASEIWWLKWLENANFTTLFVDGNHENFTMLNYLPEIDLFGSKVGKVNDSVYHLKRGNIYNIDGVSILTMGGAQSIDRQDRIAYTSWWPEEIPNMKEENNAFTNLEKVNHSVDYILSHTAPSSITYEYLISRGKQSFMKDPTEKLLEEIYKTTKFKKWYFGHFHNNWESKDKKFRLLYHDIITIGG